MFYASLCQTVPTNTANSKFPKTTSSPKFPKLLCPQLLVSSLKVMWNQPVPVSYKVFTHANRCYINATSTSAKCLNFYTVSQSTVNRQRRHLHASNHFM